MCHHDVEALVYDALPADLIISLNYPSFTKLWNEVEQQKVGINAVFTRQHAQHEVEEESSAEVINESKSTPLSEILGDAYDFPQTILSVKQLLPEWPSTLPALAEALEQDDTTIAVANQKKVKDYSKENHDQKAKQKNSKLETKPFYLLQMSQASPQRNLMINDMDPTKSLAKSIRSHT